MKADKCERCGKFRNSEALLYVDYGDNYGCERILECFWCMSPADRELLEITP